MPSTQQARRLRERAGVTRRGRVSQVVIEIHKRQLAIAPDPAQGQGEIGPRLQVAAPHAEREVVDLVGAEKQQLGDAPIREARNHAGLQEPETAGESDPRGQPCAPRAPRPAHHELGIRLAVGLYQLGGPEDVIGLGVGRALVLAVTLGGLGVAHLAVRADDGEGRVVKGRREPQAIACHPRPALRSDAHSPLPHRSFRRHQ